MAGILQEIIKKLQGDKKGGKLQLAGIRGQGQIKGKKMEGNGENR